MHIVYTFIGHRLLSGLILNVKLALCQLQAHNGTQTVEFCTLIVDLHIVMYDR